MTKGDYTEDDFLGGLITLKQPAKGYRITSDTVFLSASLKPKSSETVLDVGAGSGGILACLEARIEDAQDVELSGIEIQQDLLSLAKVNSNHAKYFEGDIFETVEGCEPNSFDHVVSNPPYFEKGKVSKSPYQTKAIAHGNEMDHLGAWVERCLRMVKPMGYISLVHRADRMDDIIIALKAKAGSIIVYPMFPKEGKDANRVIIRAQKGGKGHLSLKSGMIVHKSDGSYTQAAENILRHAHFLDIEQ